MKITNLIALPFAMVADAVTLGNAGCTRDIMQDERNERQIEALKALTEATKAQQMKGNSDE